ncbi:MAG: glycoside hydrolase family 92 protein, partial [Bacteroidaceae bacterium]|nr:glycoside hydrolase family 92 protein [Bacteroidaceae bacterium]
MKSHSLFIVIAFISGILMVENIYAQPVFKAVQPTDYINPFIGTGRIEGALRGNNYPGATVPFGLVQLSPDTREAPDWDCPAGYAYEETTIYGFSHTHLSGTGAADLIDILLLPSSSESRCATIDHASELAHPGYYSVRLTDDDILAELTATIHTGVHRYIYAEGARQQVYLDLDHSASKGSWGRRIEKAQLRIVDAHTVEGYRLITGWAPLRKVCFSIRFSKPITAVHGWTDGREFKGDGISSLFFNGTDLKATFTFAGEG